MTSTFPAVIHKNKNTPNLHNKSNLVNLLPITFPGILTSKNNNHKKSKSSTGSSSYTTDPCDFEYISTLPLTNCAVYQQDDTIREVITKNLSKHRQPKPKFEVLNEHQRDWLKLFKICYIDAKSGRILWLEDDKKMIDFDFLQNQTAGSNKGFYELRIRLHLVNEQLSRMAVEDKQTLNYYFNQQFRDYLLNSNPNLKDACVIAKLQLMRIHKNSELVNCCHKTKYFKQIEETTGWVNLLPKNLLESFSLLNSTKTIRDALKSTTISEQVLKSISLSAYDQIEVLKFINQPNIYPFNEIFHCRIGLDWAAKIKQKIQVSQRDTISHVGSAEITKLLGSFNNILTIQPFENAIENPRLRINIEGSQEPLIISFDNKFDVKNLCSLIENYACLDENKSLIIPEQVLPSRLPSVKKNPRNPLRERVIYSNELSFPDNEKSYDSIQAEENLEKISEANRFIDENSASAFSTELPENDDYDDLETLKVNHFQTDKSIENNLEKSRIVLKKVIGMGQFGEVFQAIYSPEKGEEIQVAVKQCKPNRNSDIENNPASKLLEEAKVMQQFDHPNILRLVGVCKDFPVYIVIEFCELGDLRNFLLKKSENINVGLKLGWSLQLASALAYLEDLNYVHRDVAARNILLLNECTIKLSDFGLSRVMFEESHEYTAAHRTKLPIKWMAPESIEYRMF